MRTRLNNCRNSNRNRNRNHNHDAKRAARDLDLDLDPAFDLRRPVKHAGRNSTGIWGVNRQGCRFSRPAPWMARGGGLPNTWRITGTPSLGEVPSVGARAFCLLLRCSKVSRRKGGTHSSRYPNNGYVPDQIQHPGRLSGRLRRQASSHIWSAGQQLESGRLSGRLRRQASSHIWSAGQQLESGRLSGRLRRQASSHIFESRGDSWIVVGCRAAIAGKPAPTVRSRGESWIVVGCRAAFAGKPAPTFGSRGDS